MKRGVFTISFLFLVWSAAGYADFIGLKFGNEFSTLKKEPGSTLSDINYSKLIVGAAFRARVTNWLSFQPDLLVDFMKIDGVNVSFLHVPAFFQFNWRFKIGVMPSTVFVGLGGQVAFRLTGEGNAIGKQVTAEKYSGSALGGVGMEMQVVAGLLLQANVRYVLGLTDYLAIEDTGQMRNFKNQGWHLSAAFLFLI